MNIPKAQDTQKYWTTYTTKGKVIQYVGKQVSSKEDVVLDVKVPWYNMPGLKRGVGFVLVGVGSFITGGIGNIVTGLGMLIGAIGLADPLIKSSDKVGSKGEGITDIIIKLLDFLLNYFKQRS